MILVNGNEQSQIEISDRGLQYGDGLFETIAYKHARFEFLDSHLNRLAIGCQRLAISFEQGRELRAELDSISAHLGSDEAVVKVIITRGSGGRGYKPDNTVTPTRIISTHPMPNYDEQLSQSGIAVRLCQHRLSHNRQLAGIKHLNRLDQIIARAEWQDPQIHEGLMLDQADDIIEGTMSNIFMVSEGCLKTPLIQECGIEGVMRQQILKLATSIGIHTEITRLSYSELLDADEIFMTNSVIGIWPVSVIEDTLFEIGPVTYNIRSELNRVEH